MSHTSCKLFGHEGREMNEWEDPGAEVYSAESLHARLCT